MQQENSVFIVEDGVLVRFCGSEDVISIPDGIVAIGARAFLGNSTLTAVTIPDSVTRIGDYAFANCTELSKVTLPIRLVEIGREAFRGCAQIPAIHIPRTLVTIGEGAFASCLSVVTITCDAGNPRFRSQENCLVEKKARRLVLGCSASVIPSGVKVIGEKAFASAKNLTALTIPKSVRIIEREAFASCLRLRSAVIPDTVERMGAGVFCGTPLAEVTLPFVGESRMSKRFSNLGYIFSTTNVGDPRATNLAIPIWLKRVHITDAPTLSRVAFTGCQHLQRITISHRTKKIARGAFSHCASLVSLDLPKRLLPTLSASVRKIAEK